MIVDAYMKGLNQFDTKLALEAMKKSATWNHLGLPALMDHGFLEMDDEHESVSKTLEYAYDDSWDCTCETTSTHKRINRLCFFIDKSLIV